MMFNEYKFRCAKCGQSGVRVVLWSRPKCCDQPMIPVGKPEHEDRDLVVKPGTICPVCKVSELKQSKTHCGGCRSEISRMDVPRVPRSKPDPAPQPSREREDQTQPTGTAVGQAVSDHDLLCSAMALAAGTGFQPPDVRVPQRCSLVLVDDPPPFKPAYEQEPVHDYQAASGDHVGVPDSVRAAIRREVYEEIRDAAADMRHTAMRCAGEAMVEDNWISHERHRSRARALTDIEALCRNSIEQDQ